MSNHDCVLVTGAFGLVGSAVVVALARQHRRVVATDLDISANHKRAQAFTARPGVEVRWANLAVPRVSRQLCRPVGGYQATLRRSSLTTGIGLRQP